MDLLHFKASGFRNLESEDLAFEPGVQLLVGANGQGKTNFLEAVYMLATLKSFRNAKREAMLQQGQGVISLKAVTRRQNLERDLELQLSREARILRVNGHPAHDVLDYFNDIKVVCFSPNDLAILHEGPKPRRRLLDRTIFQLRPQHLFLVRDYERTVRQRNALLRQSLKGAAVQSSEINAWSECMLDLAVRLTAARLDFLMAFNERLPRLYASVCGLEREAGMLHGEVSFRAVAKDGEDLHAVRDDLQGFYRRRWERLQGLERRRGSSLWGPHQEDFDFFYGDVLASRFASMGQQKSLVLAVRLTELEMVSDGFGEAPLLLIDDMSAELDLDRLQTLVGYLARGLEARVGTDRPQIFVTTVAPMIELLEPLGEVCVFRVEAGRIRRINDSVGAQKCASARL